MAAWVLVALPFALSYRRPEMVAVVLAVGTVQGLIFGLTLPRRPVPATTA